jgi:predicted DNA-binding mobile mystery protein A
MVKNMKSENRKLAREQLDRKLASLRNVQAVAAPDRGWIHVIRVALGMSLRQLALRLGVTRQSVKAMEEREAEGSISLNSLRDAADALGMQLVYVLIPRDASLERIIEQRAETIARNIVQRTSRTMELEAQEVSEERLEKAIQEKTAEILHSMPRFLWD